MYFEANGHGTVLYSKEAQAKIQKATGSAGKQLGLFMDMTNQCVGDALSDMLLVESVLFAKGWNSHDWFSAYEDLPNRLMKVLVQDRNVVQTTDAERICVKPEGLQDAINETVSKFPHGRSFVRYFKNENWHYNLPIYTGLIFRPSGTEDVVRVYAEADTKSNADQLAYEVGLLVHKIAGGVGEPPSKPQ